MTDEAGSTLREQLVSAMDAVEAPIAEAPIVTETPEASAEAGETPEQKAGRLAGRARDEKGRVLPGKAVKPDATTQGATAAAADAGSPPLGVVAALERPSSWKKIEEWNALPRPIQEEIRRREADYAKGVSTYKQEWDNAKPILDAIAPFQPLLQQHGVNADKWISDVGNVHRTLAFGTPQEKLAEFQRLAANYQIPAALAVRGQDGSWQLLAQQQPQRQQPQQQQPDVRKLVQEALQEQYTQQEVQRFAADKSHTHYNEVKSTMAGLLQSGLAESLEQAYDAALRLPQHSEIWDAMQKQQREAEDKANKEKAASAAKQARANAVSVRTATPSGAITNTAGKGLRAQLEAATDEVLGGRV